LEFQVLSTTSSTSYAVGAQLEVEVGSTTSSSSSHWQLQVEGASSATGNGSRYQWATGKFKFKFRVKVQVVVSPSQVLQFPTLPLRLAPAGRRQLSPIYDPGSVLFWFTLGSPSLHQLQVPHDRVRVDAAAGPRSTVERKLSAPSWNLDE
jgi:hypothetical protein